MINSIWSTALFMSKQNKKTFKPLISAICMAVLVATTLFNPVVLGNSYSEFDIPLEPIYEQVPEETVNLDFNNLFSEDDLWEITDEGIYDDEGEKVDELPYDNTETVINDIFGSGVDEDPTSPFFVTPPDVVKPLNEFEEYRQSIVESWGGKKTYTQRRLSGVHSNLSQQMSRFKQLTDKIQEAEDKLIPLRQGLDTLQRQILLFNQQLQITKEKVTNVEILIAEKKIQIKEVMFNLEKSKIEIGIQKEVVVDYIKLLYEEEEQYLNLYTEGSDTFKLLLADNSISENLLGKEYLSVMEQTGRQVFYDLEKTNNELEEKQYLLKRDQIELDILYDELMREKRILVESRSAKKDLLEKTKGEESEYQLLMDESIREQMESAIAIQNLQENVEIIEKQLDLLDDHIDNVKISESEGEIDDDVYIESRIGSLESSANYEGWTDEQKQEQIKNIAAKIEFDWPVAPNKITATFKDPTYPRKWGEHFAIDIRAKQFSEIIAPADGYVYQTADNGMGYSYIILAHKNNLISVYGHVSEIKVQPGSLVKRGDTIGLTGGTPGTKGAGLQTTGPHLHFEVHYKGEPVDPLEYLPLKAMPTEFIPSNYLDQVRK